MTQFNKKNNSVSLIVSCFEDFYAQVLKNKQLVASKPWEREEDKEISTPNAVATYILSNLQTFIEEQTIEVLEEGSGFSDTYYAAAQFIMVSLADEIFLSLEWPGKQYWESNLLEQRFYNTHSGGQVFFDKLDLLLKNKDPVQTDLGVLYLNALALGFQGKYRHSSDEAALASYRKRLFVFINRRDPYLFRQKIYLFPDAYAHTLEGNSIKELPTLRNWYLVLLGLGFTYLLTSYIMWYSATADIFRVLNRIIVYNNTSG